MTSTVSGHCEVAGGRIYYEVEGDGEPVLFIHAGVANLRMWDQQAAALGDRYRVIRFDTRGYGRTESDHVEFSNRADAAAVLDEVGEVSAHIVGLSRGGHIALDFALEYPTRTRSLAVVAGGVGGYESPSTSTVDWDEVEAWEQAKDWDRLTEFETAYWVDGPGQPRDRVAAGDPRHGHGLDRFQLSVREGGGHSAAARSSRRGAPGRPADPAVGDHR